MPPQPRRNSQARPGDLTGARREQLVKDNAEELRRRENELGLTLQAEAEQRDNEIVDVTNGAPVVIPVEEIVDTTAPVETPEPVAPAPAQVIETEVITEQDWEIIQVIEDLEKVTIGAGNHLDFEVGRKYKVSKNVANHLREKGYVYGNYGR